MLYTSALARINRYLSFSFHPKQIFSFVPLIIIKKTTIPMLLLITERQKEFVRLSCSCFMQPKKDQSLQWGGLLWGTPCCAWLWIAHWALFDIKAVTCTQWQDKLKHTVSILIILFNLVRIKPPPHVQVLMYASVKQEQLLWSKWVKGSDDVNQHGYTDFSSLMAVYTSSHLAK